MDEQKSAEGEAPVSCLCVSPERSPARAAGVPRWARDGKLLEDTLKAEIGLSAEKLSAEGDEAKWREGAELLYCTMTNIWGLETGELSRGAADIACDEIRY